MRKKEIMWVSRDKTDGQYDIWKTRPYKNVESDYECTTSNSILVRNAAINERFDIILKRGGLAKVTIERQY